MKTLADLLREVDEARAALEGFRMTNHLAYLRWSPADRIEFDVAKQKAVNRLMNAEAHYRAAIGQAALDDERPTPPPRPPA